MLIENGAITKNRRGAVSMTTEESEAGLRQETPKLDEMMRNARQASDFLKALSHETRLLLLCHLAEGERSVTDLENILSLRQPTVSQQLARLRLDGLVNTRRDGKIIYYSIAGEDIKRVIALVYDIFCKGGDRALKTPRAWRD
jgi:DNA-binding transcriptional ArsR family regulator